MLSLLKIIAVFRHAAYSSPLPHSHIPTYTTPSHPTPTSIKQNPNIYTAQKACSFFTRTLTLLTSIMQEATTRRDEEGGVVPRTCCVIYRHVTTSGRGSIHVLPALADPPSPLHPFLFPLSPDNCNGTSYPSHPATIHLPYWNILPAMALLFFAGPEDCCYCIVLTAKKGRKGTEMSMPMAIF